MKEIEELVKKLTSDLRLKQENVLKTIGEKLNENNYSFQQFNGRFGGKNNTYVDSVNTQFLDFDDFFARWLKGLIDKYEEVRDYQMKKYGQCYENDSSVFKNYSLIQNKEIFINN